MIDLAEQLLNIKHEQMVILVTIDLFFGSGDFFPI